MMLCTADITVTECASADDNMEACEGERLPIGPSISRPHSLCIGYSVSLTARPPNARLFVRSWAQFDERPSPPSIPLSLPPAAPPPPPPCPCMASRARTHATRLLLLLRRRRQRPKVIIAIATTYFRCPPCQAAIVIQSWCGSRWPADRERLCLPILK